MNKKIVVFKYAFLSILSCVLIAIKGKSQSSPVPTIRTASYHPASTDKPSWQWLNLMMSTTYYRVVKEGMVDFDSCLLYASRSLGMSRLPLLAEGIENLPLIRQTQWIDRRDPATGIKFLAKTTGKQRIEQLLLVGSYYAFQPESYGHQDSAKHFLTSAMKEAAALKEKSLERQAKCLLGKVYFEMNQVQRGDSVFSNLVRECKEAGDKKTEARAYLYWGLFPNYNPATTPDRITYFQKAADVYHQSNNIEGEINALTDAGYMLVTLFKLEDAQSVFADALELARKIDFPYVHYNTDALAMVTMWQGKFGEPLRYTLETIRTAERSRDSIGWAFFYNRLGSLYQMEGGREGESVSWLSKASDRFLVQRDPDGYVNLYNLSSTRFYKERSKEAANLISSVVEKIPPGSHPRNQLFYHVNLSNLYYFKQQYKLALENLVLADRIRQQYALFLRAAQYESAITLSLGMVYYATRQYDLAKKYFERYFADPHRDKSAGNEAAAYRNLISIDSVLGDAASAVKHYKHLDRLNDSTYRISKIRQAEELQVMYETEEKEAQITLLSQQAKLEQANLRQAKLIRNVTFAGIVAALIIAGLLYRQNRQRQKSNVVIIHKNEQLQHLLTEKEWLLKEIHHRVKNNLQVVMSLLNSQTAFIDNPYALTAIHDSQHRVHAMSLIHQKLYGSENVSSIDMSVYIKELVSYLADSFDAGQRIRFTYEIDQLEIDATQAVPLGLIINEAITNSIKYAFPDRMRGVVSISFTVKEGSQCLLIISDNGIGIPADLNSKKRGSLGMTLMAGLSGDLDADYSIENRNGTTIKVSFVPHLRKKQHVLSSNSTALTA